MTITGIKNYKANSGLEKAVKKIILNNVTKDYLEDFFSQVFSYGCVSGMISELVYYADTLKFFKKHREDINELLILNYKLCCLSMPAELKKTKRQLIIYIYK